MSLTISLDTIHHIIIFVLCSIIGWLFWQVFDKKIFPWLVEKKTKEIEKNPKWILSKAKENYGFSDIDFVIVQSSLGPVPRFRADKTTSRLQLLIDESTTTRDVDDILRLALLAKIKVSYGLWFPDKPLHWLSILCYMLDGGDITQEATSWEEAHSKSK